jgi:hypothetical protein
MLSSQINQVAIPTCFDSFVSRAVNKKEIPIFMNNPENFLGPNYKDLFNFWKFVDSLWCSEFYDSIYKKWYKLRDFYTEETFVKAKDDTYQYLSKYTKPTLRFLVLQFYPWQIYSDQSKIIGIASWEIIAMKELLEDKKHPYVLSTFIGVMSK